MLPEILLTASIATVAGLVLGVLVGRSFGYRAGLRAGRAQRLPAPPRPAVQRQIAPPTSTDQLRWLEHSDETHTGQFEGHPFVAVTRDDRVVQIRMQVPGLPRDMRFGSALEPVFQGNTSSVDGVDFEGHEPKILALNSDKVTRALVGQLAGQYDLLVESGRLVLTVEDGPPLDGIRRILQDAADLVPRLRYDPEQLEQRLAAHVRSRGIFGDMDAMSYLLRSGPPTPEVYLETLRDLFESDPRVLFLLEKLVGSPAHPDLEALVVDHDRDASDRMNGLRWLIENPRLACRTPLLTRVALEDPEPELQTLAVEALVRSRSPLPATSGLPGATLFAPRSGFTHPDIEVEVAEPTATAPRRIRCTLRLDRPIGIVAELLPEEDPPWLRSQVMQWGGVRLWLDSVICLGDVRELALWEARDPDAVLEAVVAEGFEITLRGDAPSPWLALTWSVHPREDLAEAIQGAVERLQRIAATLPEAQVNADALIELAVSAGGRKTWIALMRDREGRNPDHPKLRELLAGQSWEGLTAATRSRDNLDLLRHFALDEQGRSTVQSQAIGFLIRQHGGDAACPVIRAALETGSDELRDLLIPAQVRLAPIETSLLAMMSCFDDLSEERISNLLSLFSEVAERAPEDLLIELLDSPHAAALSIALTRLSENPTPLAIPALTRIEPPTPSLRARRDELLAELRELYPTAQGALSIADSPGTLTLADASLGLTHDSSVEAVAVPTTTSRAD